MMKLLFWRPTLNNTLGHVALKTDRYYVGFRPTKGNLPGGSQIKKRIPVSQIMEGNMKGCLALHQSIDRNCERGCDPIEYEIVIEEASNNEDVNSVVEEFLRYNGINPEDVTIERVEELCKKRKEYKLLPPEEAQNVEEPEIPIKLLPKTEYSYNLIELMSGKTEDAESFYHRQQSCVSLVFNVIQMVWLRSHPDNQPSPMSNPVELITDLPFQVFYKVPWLEKVVKKHLTSRIVASSSATMEWVDTDVLGTMSNTEMPTVYIWYPDKNNRYGHAALQTDKYHISFWSEQDVKDCGKGTAATVGIPGSLVIHQKRDMELEGNRLPTATYQIVTVTNEAINRIHEEFIDIDTTTSIRRM
ncbi:uncharacterized protein LOC124207856 [Daphnia pulex]|uniref:uncharacterized protein LOC124207856 n=1 Tax=Daphnia pulex TaxID=6669 RepID=UPI001EDD2CA4|nr:uncharacterized protein LOC124207856 [Daphnia pulex]